MGKGEKRPFQQRHLLSVMEHQFRLLVAISLWTRMVRNTGTLRSFNFSVCHLSEFATGSRRTGLIVLWQLVFPIALPLQFMLLMVWCLLVLVHMLLFSPGVKVVAKYIVNKQKLVVLSTFHYHSMHSIVTSPIKCLKK